MPLSLAVAQGRIEIVLADGLRVIVGKDIDAHAREAMTIPTPSR
jgi:hypothetical protein